MDHDMAKDERRGSRCRKGEDRARRQLALPCCRMKGTTESDVGGRYGAWGARGGVCGGRWSPHWEVDRHGCGGSRHHIERRRGRGRSRGESVCTSGGASRERSRDSGRGTMERHIRGRGRGWVLGGVLRWWQRGQWGLGRDGDCRDVTGTVDEGTAGGCGAVEGGPR